MQGAPRFVEIVRFSCIWNFTTIVFTLVCCIYGVHALVSGHYDDVIMTTIASQITSLTVVYSVVYSGADQRNINAPRHWPLCGEFTGTGEFPAQRASCEENVSIWWRHHGKVWVNFSPKSRFKSTVVPVMAQFLVAPNHYLNHCWPWRFHTFTSQGIDKFIG